VLNRLGELGRWEDTLVVVQSDHGEELDDHGCWFDHHGLYDTNVRIPLLMRLPGGRHAGRIVQPQVAMMDLAPTVAREVGLPELAAGMDGAPLQPLFDGADSPEREALYLTESTWMRKRGWRTKEWKLIEAVEPDIYGKPPIELFHLPSDPGEQVNLADSRPEGVAELAAARDAHIARRLRETGLPDPILEQADALRIWQPRFIAGKRG
jgi:arylsulfatase A-like enzyme